MRQVLAEPLHTTSSRVNTLTPRRSIHLPRQQAGADSEGLSYLPEDTQLVVCQQTIQFPVPREEEAESPKEELRLWLPSLSTLT